MNKVVNNLGWEYNNYLAHHGVKGQKWGVRRYQNPDGTLTKEGRIAYVETKHAKEAADSWAVTANDKTVSLSVRMMAKRMAPRYKQAYDEMLKKTGYKSLDEMREAYNKSTKKQAPKLVKSGDLTDRFNKASKDNPKLTYKQIYKEMKVDTRSEDPDVYKEAEDRWLRKHGY